MTSTTISTNTTTNNQTMALSTERIERAKLISQELGYLHKQITQYEVIEVPRAYSAAKSLANLFEGVARDCETRPSELERIDLKSGKVTPKRVVVGKTTTATTGNRKRKR
jgi:hypothetical protein